jgi:hypothetical protein
VAHEDEGVVPDVLDVLEAARVEVVDADHAVVLPEQVLAEMGAEEARAAAYECSRHGLILDRVARGLRSRQLPYGHLSQRFPRIV